MGEIIGLLILLGVIVLVFILPIRAALRASDAMSRADAAHGRIRDLVTKLLELQERVRELEGRTKPPQPPKATAGGPLAAELQTSPDSMPVFDDTASKPSAPPPIPSAIGAQPSTREPTILPAGPEPTAPKNVSATAPDRATGSCSQEDAVRAITPPARPMLPPRPAINLEQFMGAKLFAWIGGLALFLGVVFFVKLAIERNMVSPAARTAIGFITGAGLLVGGVLTYRKKAFTVLGQTFCATGTLILYGVTFAAHALYKFPAFGAGPTFLLMSLITVTAFLLAVRLDALVVAILGMAGGFLTPVLVSTGQDNPLGLFSYIALLDIGLVAVAKHRRWLFLTALGAAGTIIMQMGWFAKFFHSGHYFEDSATFIPVGIFVFFAALFLAGSWWSRKRDASDLFPGASTLGLCASAMFFAFVFLEYGTITARPALLYSLVFTVNALVLVAISIQPRLAPAQIITAGITFIHLAIWTDSRLTNEMLPAGLACFLVFGLMHSTFPVVWRRLRPHDAPRLPLGPWIPVFALVLMLMPILKLEAISFLIWPAILLVDLLLIVLAVITAALAPVLAAVVLTLVAAAMWLFTLPAQIASLTPFLIVLGAFSVILAAAGCWLARRLLPRQADGAISLRNPDDQLAAALPVVSSALPFLLLIMAVARLPVTVPTPLFALALLLVIVLLGLAKIARQAVLSIAALGCVLALQFAWHSRHFDAAHPVVPLAWYCGFAAVFMAYPFVFRGTFRDSVIPWAASAVSGIGHFLLIYDLVKRAYPNSMMGLLPAVFTLPPLAGLVSILRTSKPGHTRDTQLAWFGGVALFFITLIFPIQFDRQYLTLGWALEGAALCWLFTRIPHHGLRYLGVALLAAAFARLALNPAVLTYHARSGTPIFNWHLYAYTIAAAAQFAGAWWLRPPNDRIGQINVRAVLTSLGGVLLFLLLNIEIADYFTPAGGAFIAFDFSNHFARDMTYSIAWALFALALIAIGISRRIGGARWAGIGLLAVTLAKLFFHDLAAIGSIYRIAALIVVAIIALAASFLYQRFFDQEEKK